MMKQFGTILGYEIKKICVRKSTWVVPVLLIAFYLFMVAMPLLTYTTYSADSSSGQEDNYTEQRSEKIARERKDGLAWSGRKIDDSLMEEIRQNNEKIVQLKKAGFREINEAIERQRIIVDTIVSLTGTEGEEAIQMGQKDIEKAQQEFASDIWVGADSPYNLKEREVSYWKEKEAALEKPFTFRYAYGYISLISMAGIYMGMLLVSFLISIIASRIFAEEHAQKTDQIILCSRLGRKHIYFAKLLAGILFTFFATVLFTAVVFAVNFVMYGTEGFSAAVQLIMGWYAYPLTVGQVLLIMVGLEFLAAILTGIFTMVLSEGMRSSTFAMATVIGITIGARLIQIPSAFRLLSQCFNYFPVNLLKLDEGFMDLRLVSFFGMELTSWQFAPIVYVAVGILLAILGKKLYCRYQVGG